MGVLSVADPMAGLVGAWFSDAGCNVTWQHLLQRCEGKSQNSDRRGGGPSLAGSIACAISTVLCIHVYFPTTSLRSADIVSLSFRARTFIGIITSLTEAIAGRQLPMFGAIPDDNLLIPLVVGSLICWLSE